MTKTANSNPPVGGKRAILMVCDGLRRDLITPQHAPTLSRLAGEWCNFKSHTSVFPSTTRVTSASIATGCLPARHGLAGNTMALDEGEGLVCRNAGEPDFRDRMRRATGQTLRVPTLAQRLAGRGGSIVYSNVSPGAAYFQDPDGYGYVYHPSGAFGPGLEPLPESDWLRIEKGVAGDQVMTARFCEEVLRIRRPALSVLWLSEPDHTGHHTPLGSPAHREAIAGADACVAKVAAAVEALDPAWQDTLMIVCSDHGHETGEREIHIEELLVAAGLKESMTSSDVVVAPNGSAALIYMSEHAAARREELIGYLQTQEWVGRLYAGPELAEVGLETDTALAVAIDMGKSDRVNEYGVPGYSYLAHNAMAGKDYTGLGQHGGLGAYEQQPFLFARGGDIPRRKEVDRPSAPVDIAPTIARHLGLPQDGMDGKPLV
ncbi:MAG: alkaline phosphatase family protein [SAR324 cluster bacterium]|nr:alkaline phosphatase family protein [SAR324 cluster bacterium]